MKMFLTRLGFGSKIVVTGDVTQVDLPGGATSGLRVVREILDGVDDLHFAQLSSGRRRPAPPGRQDHRRLRPVRRRERAGAGAAAGTGRRDDSRRSR
jgi:phosphate starvation-inducible PhoH-like protein